jgi:hypothetical protein
MYFDDVMNQRKFGTMTDNQCEFYLNNLLQDEANLPEGANTFFELFVVDSSGNYIDVPVLIRQYRLNDPSKSYPNSQGFEVNDNWKLAKRFIIFDTISGHTSKYVAGSKPDYVRWANDIKIKVEMDMTQTEQIFRPYVILDYREKQSGIIEKSSTTPVSYTFEYFSSYSDKMTSVTIAFVFMNIFAFLVSIVRFWYFTKRNPREAIAYNNSLVRTYVFKFSLYFFDIWSELMFWTLFFFCSSVFIAYKLSMNAFLLLPEMGQQSEAEYNSFKVVLFITLAFRFFAIVMRIFEQAKADLYIVDYEKPNAESRQVNAWR